jgi:hypothetical protein
VDVQYTNSRTIQTSVFTAVELIAVVQVYASQASYDEEHRSQEEVTNGYVNIITGDFDAQAGSDGTKYGKMMGRNNGGRYLLDMCIKMNELWVVDSLKTDSHEIMRIAVTENGRA